MNLMGSRIRGKSPTKQIQIQASGLFKDSHWGNLMISSDFPMLINTLPNLEFQWEYSSPLYYVRLPELSLRVPLWRTSCLRWNKQPGLWVLVKNTSAAYYQPWASRYVLTKGFPMYSYFGDGMFRPSILLDREGFGFLGQSLQRADHHPSSSSDDSVVSGFPAMSADAVRFGAGWWLQPTQFKSYLVVVVSTHLKNICQNWNLHQIGVKIDNI